MCVFKDNEYKLIIPKDQRNQLIKTVHETFVHIGINKALYVLKKDYYWPNIEFDVRSFINLCHYCNKRKVHHVKKVKSKFRCKLRLHENIT